MASSAPFADDPPEGPAETQVALPGQDGNRAEELLAEAKRAGTATLADVTRSAVERRLGAAQKPAGKRLFDDAERAQLAHVLGATLATANLLGRARIRERQRRAEDVAKFCQQGPNAGKPGPCPTSSPTPKPKSAGDLKATGAEISAQMSYSPAHVQALADYTSGGSNFAKLNAALRSGTLTPALQAQADRLSQAIQSQPPLKEPVTVYRGIDLPKGEEGQKVMASFEAAAKSGKPITAQGFGSSSLDLSHVAREYAGTSRGVILEIEAKHGAYITQAVYDEHARRGDPSPNQHEMILDRGAQFTVSGMEERDGPGGKKIRVVKMRQVVSAKHSFADEPGGPSFASLFAEADVQAFADFADPIPLLSPQAAVNYFRNLVPELGTDPKRFGRDMRRQAFTLAAATEETLVGKVQGEIATFLATGRGSYQRGTLTLPGGRKIALTHEGPRAQAGGEVMVVVDVAKLDEQWQQNERGLYIPEGGGGPESEGGYEGRRKEVQKFLRSNNTLQASAVQMIGNGVQFADGRHRFSVLRDMGVEALPVSVPAEDAERVAALVGYEGRPPGAGVETLSGPQAVGRLLDQAGVSPQNPGYSELVFRTNAMDAYNTGSEEERQDPDVIETFPVWQYSNPDDGRSRPKHAAKNGKYYAAEVSFFAVRGTDAGDVIQCRCVPIPVSVYEWRDLVRQGARLEQGHVDLPPEAKSPRAKPAPPPDQIPAAVRSAVQSTYPDAPPPIGGVEHTIPVRGGREVMVIADPETRSAQIDFINAGDEPQAIGQELRPGSIDLARSLTKLATGLHKEGVRITFTATERRSEVYRRVLERSGYRLVSREESPLIPGSLDEVWEPLEGGRGKRGA